MSYDWDKYYSEKESTDFVPDEVMVEEISSWIPGKAVDLGAGEGADALWLAGRGWDVTAVDASKHALRTLLEEAKQRKVSIHAICSDLLKFVTPHRFNLVYLAFVHFSASDRPALLRKAKSLLKHRGKLVYIGVINPDEGNAGLPDELFPTQKQLIHEFSALGMDVIKARKLYRKLFWSANGSFEGETTLLIAEK